MNMSSSAFKTKQFPLEKIDLYSVELCSGLEKRGLKNNNVFFKCIRSDIYQDNRFLFGKDVFDTASFKHPFRSERAVVVRYKELEITGEFNQLEKIYRVMPESTAIPICLVTFRNNVVGYLAENVSGTPFLSLKRDKRVKYLNECVIPVIYKLHQNNIGHGDILVGNSEGGGNIFIVENGIKLIDPLPGYKGITDKERIELDIENIKMALI